MDKAIKEIIDTLAETRPFFHLEADFQIALANSIKEWIGKKAPRSEAKIYLEKKIGPKGNSMSVDIVVKLNSKEYFIEVKYATKEKEPEQARGLRDKENFANVIQYVAKSTAPNLNRYGFWKDVHRLEGIVNGEGRIGYAIFLTTDPLYWDEDDWKRHSDVNFKMCKQREKVSAGVELVWTGKNPKDSIIIKNEYALSQNWHPYGKIGQYLLLQIPPGKKTST